MLLLQGFRRGPEPEPDRKPSADEVDEAAKNGECVVCLDERNNYILMPCGHQCVCEVAGWPLPSLPHYGENEGPCLPLKAQAQIPFKT